MSTHKLYKCPAECDGCICSGFPWDNGRHRKGSASPDNGWFCYHWKGYEDVYSGDGPPAQ